MEDYEVDDDRGSKRDDECSGCTYYSHHLYEDPCINCEPRIGKDPSNYSTI